MLSCPDVWTSTRNGAGGWVERTAPGNVPGAAASSHGIGDMTELVVETLYPGWGQRFVATAILARERTPFQEIIVFQSATHGRVLMLDGCVQITEADEFVYQEMIAHVPLLAHGAARRVLIIGAGDGGVLRRVLQHRTIEAVTMVEIDEAVIRLSREHLPVIAGNAWNDLRATVIVGDGIAYVAQAAAGSYDVVIVDSTDPAGVGEALFTAQFYADCARVLGEGGVIVNQCGVPFMQAEELRETSKRRAVAFRHVTAYVVAVPTYVGGYMTIGFATNTPGLDQVPAAALQVRAEIAGVLDATRYWSPSVQVGAFALPPYIACELPARVASQS